MSPVCICARPDATSPDDPWVNPNCPAHSRYSLGNVWRQKARDRELQVMFVLIGLAILLLDASWLLGLK